MTSSRCKIRNCSGSAASKAWTGRCRCTKGCFKARLDHGNFQTCNVIGLDDATLVGGPPEMVLGELADLRRSDGVIVDIVGASDKLAKPTPSPGGKPIPLQIGDTLELNDHRAIVVGIAK